MNQSKIATSEICQKCGRCCKSFREIVGYDYAKRFLLLDTDRIVVKEIKLNDEMTYHIAIHKFPCSKLEKRRDGKYYCTLYGNKEKPRPHLCKTYPDEVPLALMEYERKICPALDEFMKGRE